MLFRSNKSAVLIDLKKHRDLWEDFYDRAVALRREHEPRESLVSVKVRQGRGGRVFHGPVFCTESGPSMTPTLPHVECAGCRPLPLLFGRQAA